MVTRHEFLAQLHALIKPKVYLEIGVQHGYSLNLAHAAEVAIGIDPKPLVAPKGNQVIHAMTSDEFFGTADTGEQVLVLRDMRVDLAFIDGMHLWEFAMRDFLNLEPHLHSNSVVVFDDVLPRNQAEASRDPETQFRGDWTGDVWKVFYALTHGRPDLTVTMVDTAPTGLMMVDNPSWPKVEPARSMEWFEGLLSGVTAHGDVPMGVLSRVYAVSAEYALERVRP